MKLVITMSRRFGTGASIIARELSDRLKIPVYDKAYIEHEVESNDYHMILDTSRLGIENCAGILMQYFERMNYI